MCCNVLQFNIGKVCAFIHPLNSWEEEDGTVILWVVRLFLPRHERSEPFHVTEFRPYPQTGTVETRAIDSTYNVEFPGERERLHGKFCEIGKRREYPDRSSVGDGPLSIFTVRDASERSYTFDGPVSRRRHGWSSPRL